MMALVVKRHQSQVITSLRIYRPTVDDGLIVPTCGLASGLMNDPAALSNVASSSLCSVSNDRNVVTVTADKSAGKIDNPRRRVFEDCSNCILMIITSSISLVFYNSMIISLFQYLITDYIMCPLRQ